MIQLCTLTLIFPNIFATSSQINGISPHIVSCRNVSFHAEVNFMSRDPQWLTKSGSILFNFDVLVICNVKNRNFKTMGVWRKIGNGPKYGVGKTLRTCAHISIFSGLFVEKANFFLAK